jgi:hypothetical protein
VPRCPLAETAEDGRCNSFLGGHWGTNMSAAGPRFYPILTGSLRFFDAFNGILLCDHVALPPAGSPAWMGGLVVLTSQHAWSPAVQPATFSLPDAAERSAVIFRHEARDGMPTRHLG